jgi:hypothetical protein
MHDFEHESRTPLFAGQRDEIQRNNDKDVINASTKEEEHYEVRHSRSNMHICHGGNRTSLFLSC